MQEVYTSKLDKIDTINTSYYDKDEILVRVPHEIPPEEIQKLRILKRDGPYGGFDYSIVLDEGLKEWIVCENRFSEDRCIWEYFYHKLNFPHRKVDAYLVKKHE